jgi:hypothetical protein
LILQKNKTKDVRDIGFNPHLGSPTIDVLIDGMLITRVQVDGSFNLNLMNAKSMEKLGLIQLKPTTLISRMVNQSWVKPIGVLS